ncbi:ribonuclease H-like domain-containing protein [Tanacetum coccineum]
MTCTTKSLYKYPLYQPCMMQEKNDQIDYSQHLSDDEASIHEEASDSETGTNKPKQHQQQHSLLQTTTISNIKLAILKKDDMEDYGAMNGVVRILPPVSAAEIHAVEKERKAKTILLMAIPKEHLRRFHGMDDAKEIWEATRTILEVMQEFKEEAKDVTKTISLNHFLYPVPEGLEKGYDSASKTFLLSHPHSKSSTNKVKSGHTSAYSTYTPTSSNNIHTGKENINDCYSNEEFKKKLKKIRIDGNKPVGFDKKKLECFKCHNTGHFARECPSKGTNDGKKRDSFYQDQGAGKKEQNQNCQLLLNIERKDELQRLDALAAKRLNDEFEMSEQQRHRAVEV